MHGTEITSHNTALHCTMDELHSNSFFHHANTGTLSLPHILLQHSHRLKPLLQLFPLQPCRTTQASTAGSLSTWPNPGSNKNQQINLGCAILSLKEPCMHLYFSPFRYGETCFSISLLDCGGHWKHQYLGEGARKDETTGSHVCSSLCYF